VAVVLGAEQFHYVSHGLDAGEVTLFDRDAEGFLERVDDHEHAEGIQEQLLAQVAGQRYGVLFLSVGPNDERM